MVKRPSKEQPMKNVNAVLVILVLLIGMIGVYTLQQQPSGQSQPLVKESAYDRVMRTQTIRCGYITWKPFFVKDPNSGALSGIFYDYTEALGKALNLKIEWTEETSWGDFPAALGSGRFDAMCAGSYPNSARARVIDFVRPILYQPAYAYTREGDKRFDNHPEAINDPQKTIAVVEGSTMNLIATQDFPHAKDFLMPEMTSLADSFVSVASGKADVTLSNATTAEEYMHDNPGKIRRVENSAPLSIFPNALAVGGGQDRLRRMLDIATGETLNSGTIDAILAKYPGDSDTLLRVSQPYKNN